MLLFTLANWEHFVVFMPSESNNHSLCKILLLLLRVSIFLPFMWWGWGLIKGEDSCQKGALSYARTKEEHLSKLMWRQEI